MNTDPQIALALEQWAENHVAPDTVVLGVGVGSYTPRTFADCYRDGKSEFIVTLINDAARYAGVEAFLCQLEMTAKNPPSMVGERHVLVVDDVRIFEFDATYARTSEEGLALLESRQMWNEIWLDHDLGGDDTTVPVVDRMCELAHAGTGVRVLKVFVHSSNPAAENLVRTLVRYGYNAYRKDPSDVCIGALDVPDGS